METKIIRLCSRSPETKAVCSQRHMIEVIFYAEFVSNTISKKKKKKNWTKEIGYSLTTREDPEVLFTVFLNI